MFRRCLVALAPLAFTLAFAGQALAQTPLDDPLDDHSAKRLDRMEKVMRELRAVVFQGRETGRAVVVQPAETEGQIAALTDRLNDLDHSLTRLNGQIEILRHDLDQSRQESLDLRAQNATLKEQLGALGREVRALTTPPPPPPQPEEAAATAPPQAPAAAFAAAKGSLDAGDDASAEAGFKDFVDRFGDAPQAPEARHYLGKALLARRAWAAAATAEIGAIRGWPRTRWAPEAVLDLSRALVGLKKSADACQTLDELAKRYPKAAAGVKSGAALVRAEAKCG